MKTPLFLLGGSPAYEIYAAAFVAACGGANARMAALVQSAEGWEKHHTLITQPWIRHGVTHIAPIFPNQDGSLEVEAALEILQAASGIFIGGGQTPTYHRLFATGALRALIQQRYQQGVPVAGVSAGALVSIEICQLTPDETGKQELEIAEGLGLASGFVIGVHYSERNALPEMLQVMAQTRTEVGLGIDEPACVVCEEGQAVRTLGQAVYRVKMLDFEKLHYRIDQGLAHAP